MRCWGDFKPGDFLTSVSACSRRLPQCWARSLEQDILSKGSTCRQLQEAVVHHRRRGPNPGKTGNPCSHKNKVQESDSPAQCLARKHNPANTTALEGLWCSLPSVSIVAVSCTMCHAPGNLTRILGQSKAVMIHSNAEHFARFLGGFYSTSWCFLFNLM